jgi:hypothetical protein
MANYRVTSAFSHAGVYHEIGELLDATSPLVTSYAAKMTADITETNDVTYAEGKGPCLNSTDGTKVFRVTVNDAGTLAAVEIT